MNKILNDELNIEHKIKGGIYRENCRNETTD